MTGLKRPAVENINSQMCLNFSFSCTIERKVLQMYEGPTGNTGCAVSLGLMNSEENYSWRSQWGINTLIRINGNRIILALILLLLFLNFFCSFLFLPVKFPVSPSCRRCFCVSFFDPIFFFETCSYLSSSLNPMYASRKSLKMEHSHLFTIVILCVL